MTSRHAVCRLRPALAGLLLLVSGGAAAYDFNLTVRTVDRLAGEPKSGVNDEKLSLVADAG